MKTLLCLTLFSFVIFMQTQWLKEKNLRNFTFEIIFHNDFISPLLSASHSLLQICSFIFVFVSLHEGDESVVLTLGF